MANPAPTTERRYHDQDDPFEAHAYADALKAARRAGDPAWEDAYPHDVDDVVEVQVVEAVVDEDGQPTEKHRIVKRRVAASLVPEYARALEMHHAHVAAAKALDVPLAELAQRVHAGDAEAVRTVKAKRDARRAAGKGGDA
jgi:hypothetical protein